MISDRQDKYKRLFPQISNLISSPHLISNLATMAAFIYHEFSSFWVGFYLFEGNELLIGPYQGPVACICLPAKKGVCWKAVSEQKSIIVPNVDIFEDHISCHPSSKSEIAIPLRNKKDEIIGVLDIDGDKYNMFDETDRVYLERYLDLIKH